MRLTAMTESSRRLRMSITGRPGQSLAFEV